MTTLAITSALTRLSIQLKSTIIGLVYKGMSNCISNPVPPADFLHTLPIPKDHFPEVTLDFVGTLVPSKGFDMILVMTD